MGTRIGILLVLTSLGCGRHRQEPIRMVIEHLDRTGQTVRTDVLSEMLPAREGDLETSARYVPPSPPLDLAVALEGLQARGERLVPYVDQRPRVRVSLVVGDHERTPITSVPNLDGLEPEAVRHANFVRAYRFLADDPAAGSALARFWVGVYLARGDDDRAMRFEQLAQRGCALGSSCFGTDARALWPLR